jgi:FMN-dependent NADH-azoreductase
MYNFSIPSQLKAWIDRLAQPGKTFRYTANGHEGLAGDKKVIVVSSRGGVYAGTPFEVSMDHQEAYLRAMFGFFGIQSVSFVRAEGVNMSEERKGQALQQAVRDIQEMTYEAAW